MKSWNFLIPLTMFLAACHFAQQPEISSASPEISVEASQSFTPMLPCCTPPLCGMDEVFYCPGECPCGCGTTCATRTVTPTPLSFVCLDCEVGSALEAICPLATADEDAREMLLPYGEVVNIQLGDESCLYVSISSENWGQVYYVDKVNSTVQFVMINPYLLTPSPTFDPAALTPITPLPFRTATPMPLFFACADCGSTSAIEIICPMARGDGPARELLNPYGEVQNAVVGDHLCLFSIRQNAYNIYGDLLYYVDDLSGDVRFAVIDPTYQTPVSTP